MEDYKDHEYMNNAFIINYAIRSISLIIHYTSKSNLLIMHQAYYYD